MADDKPAAEKQPKALAIVREDFTTDEGDAFTKGGLITEGDVFKALRKGPHAEFILPLAPAKN